MNLSWALAQHSMALGAQSGVVPSETRRLLGSRALRRYRAAGQTLSRIQCR